MREADPISNGSYSADLLPADRVGSGNALATAGPAGALIAFGITGIIVYFIMQCLGEMATALPIPGSFITYATRFVDPALGFATGYAYFFLWLCVLANEYVSVSLLLRYWPAAQVVPSGAWIAIFWVIVSPSSEYRETCQKC